MCIDEALDLDQDVRCHHNRQAKEDSIGPRSGCGHRRRRHGEEKKRWPEPILQFSGKYRFLSNFYRAPVEYDGLQYPTVEHAFQAAKTCDRKRRIEISLLPTPGQAKKAGRSLQLRSNWEMIKVELMLTLLREKYSKEPPRSQLLATGESDLVEGNHWGDQFWGICNGVGLNLFGHLTMQIRGELRSQKAKKGVFDRFGILPIRTKLGMMIEIGEKGIKGRKYGSNGERLSALRYGGLRGWTKSRLPRLG